MLIPKGGDVFTASTYMNFVYDPKIAAQIEAYVNYVWPVKGAKEELAKIDPELAENTLIFPTTRRSRHVHHLRREGADNQDYIERWQTLLGVSERGGDVPAPPPEARRRTCCSRRGSPGSRSSSSSRSGSSRYQSLAVAARSTSATRSPGRRATTGTRSSTTASSSSARSITRASRPCSRSSLSYPLAYWIAFRGGRWKNLLLLFDRRAVLRHLPDPDARVAVDPRRPGARRRRPARRRHRSATTGACSRPRPPSSPGITYNFLPFMALPLYVSLEQIDQRLIEAAQDLYASKWKAFLRVTLPLSLPGVVAGTLLTFIPAAGDFINAQLLGTPQQHMIGNVIQSKFLELTDYPAAAALSFVLMAAILVARRRLRPRRSARRSSPDERRASRRAHALTVYALLAFALPAAADRGRDRCSRSTTRPAASTTPGRASRSTTGGTGTACRASRDAMVLSLEIARSRASSRPRSGR